MPSEMVSGPDLGAGYLHQLTLDREGDPTTFTYHAQEGGLDAGGPPKGSLEPFGYTHPASPCQFGGPRCWHRRFLLPMGETAKVRLAYNRSRFVLEAMLAQQYDRTPVDMQAALSVVIPRLAPALNAEGIPWYVGGSTAPWLLGAAVAPRDLDLGSTRAGVDRIGSLLVEYLIEPVAPTDWPSSGIVRGARAFVGTFREGARVEWAVPLDPAEVPPWSEGSGQPGQVRTLPMTFSDVPIRVTRPEYALVRSAEAGGGAPSRRFVELARRLGPDRELLDLLLARASLGTSERTEVRRSVEG